MSLSTKGEWMRKNLGKVFLAILIFLHAEVFASAYTWSAASNKTAAYLNEPIHLKYICSFSDRAEVVTIVFNPAGEHEKYTLKNLRQSQNIVDGKRVNIYEFVAFAKVAGEIKFDFEAQMKQTTKESIENTVIGRDNMQKEQFAKESFKLETLSVNVKETDKSIVGNFSIEVKKHEPKVKAHEPYHIEVAIKGNGNFEALKPLEFNIDGVKIFAGDVVQKIELSENAQSGEWSQKFAFVSEADFKIPEIKIEYFNLAEQKSDVLMINAIDVSVAKGFSKEELLDKVEDDSFKFDYSYLYYIFTFIAGFLAAKVKIKKRVVKLNADEEFRKKIDETKSLNELMVLLALRDSKKYEQIILDIESKTIVSLSGAKLLLKVTK
jgi:hypothetical protein